MTEIKIVSTETSEQLSMVEVDEMTVAPNPSISSEVPASEPSSSVTVVQSLINLEEERTATDAEEEPEAAVNPSVISISKLVFLAIVALYFLVRL